jgi:hypothetical protein
MTGDSGSVQSKDSSGVAQQIEAAPSPSTEYRSPDQPTNIPEVEQQLKDLIESYKIALRSVAGLPTFGRLDTKLESKVFTIKDDKLETNVESKPSKRIVARPFVRLFVESHIRQRLKLIHRLLCIEAISLDENDANAKKVALWLKRLQETRESIRSLGRTYSLLIRALPLVSLLLPFLGAFLLQVMRVDVSNPNEIMRTAVTLVQTQRTSLLLVLSNAALLLVYIYILLAPAVLKFGFRCKRAILNGGRTDPYYLTSGRRGYEVEIWNNFPGAKIYKKESDLFATLEAKEPEEIPLDLIASPLPFTILIIASVFTRYAWRDLAAGISPHPVQLGFLVILWSWLIGKIMTNVELYKRRKKERAIRSDGKIRNPRA